MGLEDGMVSVVDQGIVLILVKGKRRSLLEEVIERASSCVKEGEDPRCFVVGMQ